MKGIPPDGVEGDSPSDEPKIEEVEEEKEEKTQAPKTKKIKETVSEWKVVNDEKPIWCQKPDDVDEENIKVSIKN